MVYNTPVMRINIKDFVKSVYKKGYSMRAVWRGEVSGEVTLFRDRLSFDDENLEILIFSEKEFDKCGINYIGDGMVEIAAGENKWFFKISKNIDKGDFWELL